MGTHPVPGALLSTLYNHTAHPQPFVYIISGSHPETFCNECIGTIFNRYHMYVVGWNKGYLVPGAWEVELW